MFTDKYQEYLYIFKQYLYKINMVKTQKMNEI